MATMGNGISVSFANTPQAKDDYASATEDLGIALDVLANDLGGAAKTLYSVNQPDLLTPQLVGISKLGATIKIVNGQIYYDSTGASALAGLAGGETTVDTFQYAIRLGNGTISTATAYVTVTGTNDAPILSADTVANHAMTEIAGVTNGTGAEGASGTLSFKDVDLTDHHTVASALASATWSGGSAIPADTAAALAGALSASVASDSTGSGAGTVAFSFSLADKLADFLAAGETLTVTYNVSVNDGHGGTSTQPVTLTSPAPTTRP